MPQRSYMDRDEEGIAVMLMSFDDNIAPLQGKYALSSGDLLRVKQARMAWRWFLDCLSLANDWTESVTAKKTQMRFGPGFGPQAMPGGPVCPAVPLIDMGLGPVPIQWEPNFFAYFGSLVARIKGNQAYVKTDGDLLGIEGAEIPPPDPMTVPDLKVNIGPGGMPQLEVPKQQFDGYDFQYKIGDGAVQQGTFVSTRRYVHVITLPPAGQAAMYSYRVQYRYKGVAFGQWSMWVPVSVHG